MYLVAGDQLQENLGITWDRERVVDNLFATFEPDKLEELVQLYNLESTRETNSPKNLLHKFMISGNTEVADKMIEMGLDLNKVDLQGLLIYALQPKSDRAHKEGRLVGVAAHSRCKRR